MSVPETPMNRPTVEEEALGKIAADVVHGRLTPLEAQKLSRHVRFGYAPRPDRSATRAQVPR